MWRRGSGWEALVDRGEKYRWMWENSSLYKGGMYLQCDDVNVQVPAMVMMMRSLCKGNASLSG